MKTRALVLLASIVPSIALCQTDGLDNIRQELAQDRQQLNIIVRNQPPPARIISMPGESNQERAQRHEEALRLARESWKTEWGQEHPLKSSFEAPPMPDEMRNDAIRDSDAKYVEDHSKTSAESAPPLPPAQSPQVTQLKARIATLERILSQQSRSRSRTNDSTADGQGSSSQQSSRQAQFDASWKAIKVGMKKSDVIASIGKPNADSGNRWLYSGHGVLTFDATGTVQTVEPQSVDQ